MPYRLEKKITPLSKKIYEYLKSEINKEKMPPTHAEIAKYCGHKTVSAVQESLERLEDLNLITRIPGRARSIKIL